VQRPPLKQNEVPQDDVVVVVEAKLPGLPPIGSRWTTTSIRGACSTIMISWTDISSKIISRNNIVSDLNRRSSGRSQQTIGAFFTDTTWL